MLGIAAKRNILLGFVIVFAAWPLAHHVIVRTMDLSPWKGFAWSMYCVPLKKFRIYAVTIPDRGPLPPRGEDWPADVLRAHARFTEMRQTLRHHAGPEPYARSLFAAYPGIAGVEVTVEQYGVDRATSRLTLEHSDTYAVLREELDAR